MKIFIDDVRPLPEGFDVKVSSCNEFFDVLLKTAYDREGEDVELVSFDFDLGANGTAQPIADFVEAEARNHQLPPFEWEIHSDNPVGRKRLRQALENADAYWRRQDRALDDWLYLEEIWELQLVNDERFMDAMEKLSEDMNNVELDKDIEQALFDMVEEEE